MGPQQGEQRLNAQRFERLGFGRILRNPQTGEKSPAQYAEELIRTETEPIYNHLPDLPEIGFAPYYREMGKSSSA